MLTAGDSSGCCCCWGVPAVVAKASLLLLLLYWLSCALIACSQQKQHQLSAATTTSNRTGLMQTVQQPHGHSALPPAKQQGSCDTKHTMINDSNKCAALASQQLAGQTCT
jgi:hypothetical protein